MHARCQAGDDQSRRQRERARRGGDDRCRRARRSAQAGRHHRRTDVGEHGRGSRHRRRAARLQVHLRHERQDERRKGRVAARVRRRSRRVPDRGAARRSALLLLDRRAAGARNARRVPSRPVLERREPARARADDRARDLGADARPRHALRRGHRHGRDDHRCRPVSEGAEPGGADHRRRSRGLGVLRWYRAPVSHRRNRRRLLAHHVRSVARRSRHRGDRRRRVPHRPTRDARRRAADRRIGRYRGARGAGGRARAAVPTTSSSC